MWMVSSRFIMEFDDSPAGHTDTSMLIISLHGPRRKNVARLAAPKDRRDRSRRAIRHGFHLHDEKWSGKRRFVHVFLVALRVYLSQEERVAFPPLLQSVCPGVSLVLPMTSAYGQGFAHGLQVGVCGVRIMLGCGCFKRRLSSDNRRAFFCSMGYFSTAGFVHTNNTP